MRKISAAIVMAALTLGVATVSTGQAALAAKESSIASSTDARATVKIGNFQFTPKVLTIAPGTTVEWLNTGGRHLVVADNGSFKSDVLKQGDKFEHKFESAGTFAYHCEFHGDVGGKDMAGKIVVRKPK